MNGRRWSVLSSKGQLSTARLLPRASICVWSAVWVGSSAESAMANLEPNRSGSANNVSMTSSWHTYSSSHNFVRPPSPAPILTGQAKLAEEGNTFSTIRLRPQQNDCARRLLVAYDSLNWCGVQIHEAKLPSPKGTLKEVSNAVHSSRQWRPVFGGRGTGDPVVVGAPRFDRSHGHKVRLRYRPVRRLHSVDGWRCSEILFYAGQPGRGQKDHHHRRAVFRWVTPGAARVEGV